MRETLFAEDDPGSTARFLGEIAIRRGAIDEATLRGCLHDQETAAGRGAPVLLEQVLLRRGAMKSEELARILQEKESARRVCSSCRARYLYSGPPGREPPCPGCRGRVDPPAAALRRIGKYEVLRELGRGGMGVVYLARDPALQREVAIKVLRDADLVERTQVERFLQEARHAARLRHPRIVGIHEAGEDGGRPYFVMDYVAGKTLREVFAEGSLARRQALRILEEVARALHAAHGEGLVHRDVKPGNVLVDAAGQPFVLDFGLSKSTDAANRLTRSGAPLGTVFYMSPEQVEERDVDARTDVYALGVILYEILTGHLPYRATSVVKMYNEILHGILKRPRLRDRTIPAKLERICLTAMARDREDRYGSAEAFADDLANYLAGRPVEAPRTRISRRGKAILAGATAGFGVLALVVALLLWPRSGEEPEPGEPAPPEKGSSAALVVGVALVFPETAPPVDLAVFHDARFDDDQWVQEPENLAAYLAARSFQVLETDGLRAWMLAHAQGERRGVVVFARAAMPASIVETLSESSTLHRYLSTGNTVVWLADIPLYWIYPGDGDRLAVSGGARLLGVRDGEWNDPHRAELTDAGRAWGLTADGMLERPSLACDVTTVLSKSSSREEAGSWHKNFDPSHPASGFIRYWPDNPFRGSDPELQTNALRLALHAAGRLPELDLSFPETVDLGRYDRLEFDAPGLSVTARYSLDGGLSFETADSLALPDGVSCVRGALLSIEVRAPNGESRALAFPVHLHQGEPCLAIDLPPLITSPSSLAIVTARGVSPEAVELSRSIDGVLWEPLPTSDRTAPDRWRLASTHAGPLRLRATAEAGGKTAIALAGSSRTAYQVLATRPGLVWLAEGDIEASHRTIEELAEFAGEAREAAEGILGRLPPLEYRIHVKPGDRVEFTRSGLDVGASVLDQLSYLRRTIAQGLVYHAVLHGVSPCFPEELFEPLRELLGARILAATGREAEADTAYRSHIEGGRTLLARIEAEQGVSALRAFLDRLRAAGPLLAYYRDAESLHRVLAHLVLATGAGTPELLREAAAAGEFELDPALLDREIRSAGGR
ncbi:MAG: serine/threonine protein kinase [Planctomycetes bacterium]|nr:serine/threonine protein kinase [Planctomycetota bacterium]